MTAWLVSELACGCYMRQGDGRWFYRPECPLHGHLYPKDLRDSPVAETYRLPPGIYR